MSATQIALDLQTKLKTISTYNNRVYIMASRVAYMYAKVQGDPSIVIVYVGSSSRDEKGRIRATETHRYEVHIYQSIWKEEEVVVDSSNGLIALQGAVLTAIEGVTTGYTSRVMDVSCERMGTADYPAADDGKYKASIGISVSITEDKTT